VVEEGHGSPERWRGRSVHVPRDDHLAGLDRPRRDARADRGVSVGENRWVIELFLAASFELASAAARARLMRQLPALTERHPKGGADSVACSAAGPGAVQLAL
jgi:hypothetical protein